VQREETDGTVSLGLENDAVAVAAEWSPMGLAKSHRCVLAVRDSHHRVSIWEPTGIGVPDNWTPVRVLQYEGLYQIVNVSDKLLEEFVLGDEGDEIISGNRLLTTQECEELKSHCTP